MQPFQQRVVDEKTELDSLIQKLSSFVTSELFTGIDGAEQFRLNLQLSYMKLYSDVLGERIANFT